MRRSRFVTTWTIRPASRPHPPRRAHREPWTPPVRRSRPCRRAAPPVRARPSRALAQHHRLGRRRNASGASVFEARRPPGEARQPAMRAMTGGRAPRTAGARAAMARVRRHNSPRTPAARRPTTWYPVTSQLTSERAGRPPHTQRRRGPSAGTQVLIGPARTGRRSRGRPAWPHAAHRRERMQARRGIRHRAVGHAAAGRSAAGGHGRRGHGREDGRRIRWSPGGTAGQGHWSPGRHRRGHPERLRSRPSARASPSAARRCRAAGRLRRHQAGNRGVRRRGGGVQCTVASPKSRLPAVRP